MSILEETTPPLLLESKFAIAKRERESTPAPPKEKTPDTDAISRKKEELELLRIEKEMERLKKPDVPENTYFKDMLAQQEKHFNQLLEMHKSQQALSLEIEKLKLGEGGGDDWLMDLIPLATEALKARKDAPTPERGLLDMAKKTQTPTPPTAAELEAYKLKIKAGEISEQQFIDDAIKSYPQIFEKLSREQVVAEYNKIKNAQ